MRESLQRITQLEGREIAIRTFTCRDCGYPLSFKEVMQRCQEARADPSNDKSKPINPRQICNICSIPFDVRVGTLLDSVMTPQCRRRDNHQRAEIEMDRNMFGAWTSILDETLSPSSQ